IQIGSVQTILNYSNSVRTFAVIAPDLGHHVVIIPRLAPGVAPADPVPTGHLLHREHRRGRGWNRDVDIEADLLNVWESITSPNGGADREGGGVGAVIE